MKAAEVLAGTRRWAVEQGDVLDRLADLPDESVNCCITSPPYWGLRDYGVAGQIGLEPTPAAFVARLVDVFAEVRRVLRSDGVAWVNLGDSYAGGGNGARDAERWPKQSRNAHGFRSTHAKNGHGLKDKDLVGIPWRVAFALQDAGWWLRTDVIWAKPNPMPESVTDRPTRSHEYLFLLTKSARYHYDATAIAEGALGRNKRSVWAIAPERAAGAHFAAMPTALVEPCILAGCPPDGVVLDPFVGSGSVVVEALRHGRRGIGFDLSPTYCDLARRRIEGDCPMFNQEAAS